MKIKLLPAIIRSCTILMVFAFTINQSAFSSDIRNISDDVGITGTVLDEEGQPLPGVNVFVKGTTIGSVTNVDGTYNIEVPEGSTTLVFSFIGYKSLEVEIGSQAVIDVNLSLDLTELEEIVVVGYGTVRKSDLTASVASIKGKAINEFPVTSVDQAIQARVAGVNVTQTSSAPGGGISVRIRGANSIRSGTEPLYVIDGFPVVPENEGQGTSANRRAANSLSSLNPSDIESIEILKDASGTAIYGSRGSNGVVLITTKRGKAGKTKITYDGSVSWQNIANKIERLNGSEYAEYRNLLAASQGASPLYTAAEVSAIGEGTDWLDEILRTGMINNHQLSFSGGNEKNQFAIMANYNENEGIIEGSSFTRYGIRLNMDNELIPKFLDLKSSWSYNRSVASSQSTDRQTPGDGGILLTALGLDPTVSVRDATTGAFNLASYDGRFDINPLQEAQNVVDDDFTNRILGTTALNFKLSRDLTFRSSIGVDVINVNRLTFLGQNTFLGRQRSGDLQNFSRYSTNILSENILSYSKVFGDHAIDAVVGYTYQRGVNRFTNVSSRGIPGISADNVRLQDGTNPQIPQSGRLESTLESFLGRVNYRWKGKYLATVTLRRDGASVFSGKFETFPSVALGWRIVDESFMQSQSVFSNLKLRASWGATGNSNLLPFQSQAGLQSVNYVVNGQLVTGSVATRLANDALEWEYTTMTNIGLDFGFMDDRMNLTADYFITNTDRLLLDVAVAASSGFNSVLKNSGTLENSGLDLGIDFIAVDNSNMKWDVSGNLSFVTNEITDLGEGAPFFAELENTHLGVFGSWVDVGNPIGVWRGYKMVGIWQSAEEIAANTSLPGDQPGYSRYQDTNDDGQITPEDFVIIGDPNPDLTWGLNSTVRFGKFDLGIFIRGVHGNDVRNLQASELGDGVQRINQIGNILEDSWSTTNTGGTRPIIDATRDFANYFRDSDFFIEDGSFIRFQNISLGYTFPKMEYIERARIYVSAQNLITITDYTGFDPEVNNSGQNPLNRADDYDAYPRAKVWTVGVNLGF